MKIKKSSWHYRLNASSDGVVAKSVCGYFWQTIWTFVCLSAGGLIIGSFTYILLSPVLQFVLPTKMVDPTLARVVSYLDLVMLGFIGFMWFYEKSSFLKVIGAYIKAIKNKFCPLIEFED